MSEAALKFLRDQSEWPCTCHPSYYERGRASPDCMADLVGDEAREILGLKPACKAVAYRKPVDPKLLKILRNAKERDSEPS